MSLTLPNRRLENFFIVFYAATYRLCYDREMKNHFPLPIIAGLLVLGIIGRTTLTRAQAQANRAGPAAAARETEICGNHLRSIYEAIQAYRKDHKDLPAWLSDLTPKYLADPAILQCPAAARGGASQISKHASDPRITTAYLYEFCDGEMSNSPGGQTLKMKDWKRMQMAVLGGEVPILRCLRHEPALNVGFDGKLYESSADWESRFSNVVARQQLTPAVLAARFMKIAAVKPDLEPESNPPAPGRSNPAGMPLLGKPAPNFRLDLLEGGQFDLAAHKGKHVVILDFWATWCGPCRAAMPILSDLAAEMKEQGVLYLAINLREDPNQIRDYLKQSNLKLSVPLDRDGAVGRLYQISAIPMVVIVGKDGTVGVTQTGFSPGLKGELKTKLVRLIEGKGNTPE